MEVAVGAYFLWHAKHPTEFYHGLPWQRAPFSDQNASNIVDCAGLYHLIQKLGICGFPVFRELNKGIIGIDAIGIKAPAALAKRHLLVACQAIEMLHQNMLEHIS